VSQSLKPGDIVNLVGDSESAYVVVATFANRAQVVYCGSMRWYMPEWQDVAQVVHPATINKHSRRARRWLDDVRFDPDGWRRILVGRHAAKTRVTVDHVSMSER